MANTARDLIKCRISNDPGTTGSFILDTAFTNSLLPAAADDGLKFKLNITENGVGTEIRRNCTYTHSTTTFSRGTMVRSTGAADAALSFTNRAIVSVVPSASDYAGLPILSYRRSGNLTNGVGADLVFESAGGTGKGQINFGQTIFIPANTLKDGESCISINAAYKKLGSDTSYCVIYLSPTSSPDLVNDPKINGAGFQFPGSAVNSKYAANLYIKGNKITAVADVIHINVQYNEGIPADETTIDLTEDNYLHFAVTDATTGTYRCIGYSIDVFQ
jgi:hypothetical protein